MQTSNFISFTEKEEKMTDIFIGLGLKRNVARVLVYLSSTDEATSRMIERGTDLRQPEVSIAIRELRKLAWVVSRESKADSKGRPVKIYHLALPISAIMDTIEGQKKKQAKDQLDMIEELRQTITA
jgi:predicted transcriptional regulator